MRIEKKTLNDALRVLGKVVFQKLPAEDLLFRQCRSGIRLTVQDCSVAGRSFVF